MRRAYRISWLLIGLAALSLPLVGHCGDPLLPQIPQAVKGTKCVRPTEDMRRNHMKYLLHHRDLTMHEGIRTQKYDLRECLSCHVQKAADGAQIHVDSSKHFCNSCHTYAGVKIDCFECHSDQPSQNTHFHTLSGQPLAHPGHDLKSEGKLSRGDLEVISAQGTSHE